LKSTTDKHLANLIKGKMRKTQIANIRIEKEDITAEIMTLGVWQDGSHLPGICNLSTIDYI
jgi:hypothetical protein